jgi:hypothetical protein
MVRRPLWRPLGSFPRGPPPWWRFLAAPLPLWLCACGSRRLGGEILTIPRPLRRCSRAIHRRPALAAPRSSTTRIPGGTKAAACPWGRKPGFFIIDGVFLNNTNSPPKKISFLGRPASILSGPLRLRFAICFPAPRGKLCLNLWGAPGNSLRIPRKLRWSQTPRCGETPIDHVGPTP